MDAGNTVGSSVVYDESSHTRPGPTSRPSSPASSKASSSPFSIRSSRLLHTLQPLPALHPRESGPRASPLPDLFAASEYAQRAEGETLFGPPPRSPLAPASTALPRAPPPELAEEEVARRLLREKYALGREQEERWERVVRKAWGGEASGSGDVTLDNGAASLAAAEPAGSLPASPPSTPRSSRRSRAAPDSPDAQSQSSYSSQQRYRSHAKAHFAAATTTPLDSPLVRSTAPPSPYSGAYRSRAPSLHFSSPPRSPGGPYGSSVRTGSPGVSPSASPPPSAARPPADRTLTPMPSPPPDVPPPAFPNASHTRPALFRTLGWDYLPSRSAVRSLRGPTVDGELSGLEREWVERSRRVPDDGGLHDWWGNPVETRGSWGRAVLSPIITETEPSHSSPALSVQSSLLSPHSNHSRGSRQALSVPVEMTAESETSTAASRRLSNSASHASSRFAFPGPTSAPLPHPQSETHTYDEPLYAYDFADDRGPASSSPAAFSAISKPSTTAPASLPLHATGPPVGSSTSHETGASLSRFVEQLTPRLGEARQRSSSSRQSGSSIVPSVSARLSDTLGSSTAPHANGLVDALAEDELEGTAWQRSGVDTAQASPSLAGASSLGPASWDSQGGPTARSRSDETLRSSSRIQMSNDVSSFASPGRGMREGSSLHQYDSPASIGDSSVFPPGSPMYSPETFASPARNGFVPSAASTPTRTSGFRSPSNGLASFGDSTVATHPISSLSNIQPQSARGHRSFNGSGTSSSAWRAAAGHLDRTTTSEASRAIPSSSSRSPHETSASPLSRSMRISPSALPPTLEPVPGGWPSPSRSTTPSAAAKTYGTSAASPARDGTSASSTPRPTARTRSTTPSRMPHEKGDEISRWVQGVSGSPSRESTSIRKSGGGSSDFIATTSSRRTGSSAPPVASVDHSRNSAHSPTMSATTRAKATNPSENALSTPLRPSFLGSGLSEGLPTATMDTSVSPSSVRRQASFAVASSASPVPPSSASYRSLAGAGPLSPLSPTRFSSSSARTPSDGYVSAVEVSEVEAPTTLKEPSPSYGNMGDSIETLRSPPSSHPIFRSPGIVSTTHFADSSSRDGDSRQSIRSTPFDSPVSPSFPSWAGPRSSMAAGATDLSLTSIASLPTAPDGSSTVDLPNPANSPPPPSFQQGTGHSGWSFGTNGPDLHGVGGQLSLDSLAPSLESPPLAGRIPSPPSSPAALDSASPFARRCPPPSPFPAYAAEEPIPAVDSPAHHGNSFPSPPAAPSPSSYSESRTASHTHSERTSHIRRPIAKPWRRGAFPVPQLSEEEKAARRALRKAGVSSEAGLSFEESKAGSRRKAWAQMQAFEQERLRLFEMLGDPVSERDVPVLNALAKLHLSTMLPSAGETGVEYLLDSLQLNQAQPDMAHLLAFELENRDLDQAIHWHQLAVHYGPENPEHHVALGHALARAGQVDAASHVFEGLTRGFPGEPYEAIGLYELARLYQDLDTAEDRSRAREAYEAALESLKTLRLVEPEFRFGARWDELDAVEGAVLEGMQEVLEGRKMKTVSPYRSGYPTPHPLSRAVSPSRSRPTPSASPSRSRHPASADPPPRQPKSPLRKVRAPSQQQQQERTLQTVQYADLPFSPPFEPLHSPSLDPSLNEAVPRGGVSSPPRRPPKKHRRKVDPETARTLDVILSGLRRLSRSSDAASLAASTTALAEQVAATHAALEEVARGEAGRSDELRRSLEEVGRELGTLPERLVSTAKLIAACPPGVAAPPDSRDPLNAAMEKLERAKRLAQ